MAICHDCVSRASSPPSSSSSSPTSVLVGGDCRIRLLKCRHSAGPLALHLFLFWIIAVSSPACLSPCPRDIMVTRLSLTPSALIRQLTLYGSYYLLRAAILPVASVNGTTATGSQLPVCRSSSSMASACEPVTPTPFSVSYVSINDSVKAEELARLLVQHKLAACVQILPQVTSIYTWKGKVEKEPELLLLIKSRSSLLTQMTQLIVANHPYDVCEVVSVPVSPPPMPLVLLSSTNTLWNQFKSRGTDHGRESGVPQVAG